MGAIDVSVIVFYLLSLSGIGIYLSRRQTSREEYHLGGRNVHWILAGGSVLATLISTLSYLAAPGEMIRYGIGFFTGALALPLAIPVTNRFVIPALRALPITSMYEYLERRFDSKTRTVTAAIFTVRTLLWMGLIIYSCAAAFAAITGWNLYWTIAVTGLLTTFYTGIGGFRSVVWTDNLQLAVLLGGALAIPVFIGVHTGTGPVEWWAGFSQAGRTKIEFFSFDPSVRITVVGIMATQFFWTVCTNGSDQVAAQRYLSTPSEREARRSVWVFAMLNVALNVLLMMCGLAMFAYYAGKLPANADAVMPTFIARELPPGLSGLLLAALLAAAMSSLSSGINSISGVVVTDFLAGRGSLRLDKTVALLAGLSGIVIASALAWAVRHSSWNLYELTSRVNNLLVGPVAVVPFAGMLFARATGRSAWSGFAVALTVSLFISFGGRVSFIWLVPLSFVAGLITIALMTTSSGPRLVTAVPPSAVPGQQTK
jgi:SSS family solute:Na+ symporter